MDTVSKEVRSSIMSRVRSSKNKSTEEAFIKVLRAHSIKGWRRRALVIGKPDFVFAAHKIAVFVDGCFWHYCPKHCRLPSSNASYWREKLINNRKRDNKVNKDLRNRGWIVIRFWEHEIKGGRSIDRKIQILKKLDDG